MARSRLWRSLCYCGAVVVPTLAFGLLAEGAFRLAKAVFGTPSVYQYDAELGWAPRPDFRHAFTSTAQDGQRSVVNYGTNRYGFRHWGDPSADRPRLLFVGDSFTQDPNMSNQSAYYTRVAKSLPVEVFAIGGGGYGTLQEMMIIKRYWKRIDPTHVIVQFCSNDLDNNHYAIESYLIYRSQKNFRPYLVEGRIVYRDAPIYRWLFRHSMIFRSIDQRIQNSRFRRLGGQAKSDELDQIEQLRAASFEVTREILVRMRTLENNEADWFMFNCDLAGREWVELAHQSNITPILGVAEAVEQAARAGRVVRTADGAHWNDAGHGIVGSVLVGYLAERLGDDAVGPSLDRDRLDLDR